VRFIFRSEVKVVSYEDQLQKVYEEYSPEYRQWLEDTLWDYRVKARKAPGAKRKGVKQMCEAFYPIFAQGVLAATDWLMRSGITGIIGDPSNVDERTRGEICLAG